MNAPVAEFYPGSLVSARGREWIVLPDSTTDTLRLRPLGGGEKDESLIYLPLEPQPVGPATFPWPEVSQARTHSASQLLMDALQLKLRGGAGPFRSFGNIAVEPRAYQLVPLLMALKQPTVRLLIADDVGIGKTIEGALIAREMLDRGEIQRLAVLCPPHLCEQWQRELDERFHIQAMVVRTSTASRLERDLPPGTSVFDAHPFTVVSLDYIKSERRREAFQRFCPEFVIVDEAHTCTQGGQGRQQRYQLLKGLADNAQRHMLLLTATPHSGDEEAFFNLLGLLRQDFTQLKDLPPGARADLRDDLSRHFVQRRRPDIAEWQDSSMFPDRKTAEITYRLTGAWGQLFNDVLDYARELVERAEGQGLREQRMNWWAALALLRCISSSPAAAVNALRTRLKGGTSEDSSDVSLEELETQGTERVLDGLDDGLSTDDIEPAAQTEDTARLQALIASAEGLAGASNDPKLAKLLDHLQALVKDGFKPVVFCRYIATAHYLADFLRGKFKQATVKAVTGEITPGEREAAVAQLGETDQRILVATDCLSEGINLQGLFTAVVHYDLSWNPTRHEQREGRVDRFGQQAKEVRSTMLYGEDNPVDGAVLQVILRKAESIRKELGVLVPMPDDQGKLTQALLNAVLLRKHNTVGKQAQTTFDFGEPAQAIETAWQSAREKAAKNRSIFAQRRLKPDDVLPEWRKSAAVLGTAEDVLRFVTRAMAQLGAGLEPYRQHFKAPLEALPSALKERLAADGLTGTLRIDFKQPAAQGATLIQRSHPLVVALADTLLEQALDRHNTQADGVARAGAAFVDNVPLKTTVLLLRLRHQLTVTRNTGAQTHTRLMLCEETVAVCASGTQPMTELTLYQARETLGATASRNMPPVIRDRHTQQALDNLPAWQPELEALAKARAQALLADHRRVREAAEARGSYQVTASLPVDVMGVYVLVPAAAGV